MKLVWQAEYQEVLEKYTDLVDLTWKQLQKDFFLEAIDLPEVQVVNLDEVYHTLYPQISQLIQFDFIAVMRLLYRIDISEQKVKRQMDVMPDDTAKAITILIIKREIEKVVLRKQFSSE